MDIIKETFPYGGWHIWNPMAEEEEEEAEESQFQSESWDVEEAAERRLRELARLEELARDPALLGPERAEAVEAAARLTAEVDLRPTRLEGWWGRVMSSPSFTLVGDEEGEEPGAWAGGFGEDRWEDMASSHEEEERKRDRPLRPSELGGSRNRPLRVEAQVSNSRAILARLFRALAAHPSPSRAWKARDRALGQARGTQACLAGRPVFYTGGPSRLTYWAGNPPAQIISSETSPTGLALRPVKGLPQGAAPLFRASSSPVGSWSSQTLRLAGIQVEESFPWIPANVVVRAGALWASLKLGRPNEASLVFATSTWKWRHVDSKPVWLIAMREAVLEAAILLSPFLEETWERKG